MKSPAEDVYFTRKTYLISFALILVLISTALVAKYHGINDYSFATLTEDAYLFQTSHESSDEKIFETPRVFNLGLMKTGTSTLKKTLESVWPQKLSPVSHFGDCTVKNQTLSERRKALKGRGCFSGRWCGGQLITLAQVSEEKILDHFETTAFAQVDCVSPHSAFLLPQVQILNRLAVENNPESIVFTLTTRNHSTWVNSVMHWLNLRERFSYHLREKKECSELGFQFPDGSSDEELLYQFKVWFEGKVRKVTGLHGHRVLELNIDGDKEELKRNYTELAKLVSGPGYTGQKVNVAWRNKNKGNKSNK